MNDVSLYNKSYLVDALRDSDAEVQRLIVENKKLRRELKALKRKNPDKMVKGIRRLLDKHT